MSRWRFGRWTALAVTLALLIVPGAPGAFSDRGIGPSAGLRVDSGPSAPTGLHATTINATSVTLGWTQPAGTILNDTMAYGSSCAALTSSKSLGPVSAATIGPLVTGQLYCFEVQAWTSGGGSPFSVPLNATPAPYPSGSSAATAEFVVNNLQGAATGSPFQQMLTVNSSAYARFLNSNWTNAQVYYSNGSAIESWIESNATNSSTRTILWLRVNNIPAGTAVPVYVEFYPKAAFELSEQGPMGEAPQLSTTYGEWDDGWRVFPDGYWNWSGSNIPAGWNTFGPGTETANNGLNIRPTSGSGGIAYSTPVTTPYAFETRGEPNGGTTGRELGLFIVQSGGTANNWWGISLNQPSWSYGVNSAEIGFSYQGAPKAGVFYTLSDEAFTSTVFAVNYSTTATTASSIPAGYFIEYWADGGATTVVQWTRLRELPSTGIMPSVYANGPVSGLVPSAPTGLIVGSTYETSVVLGWKNPPGPLVNDTVYYGVSCSALRPVASTGGPEGSAFVRFLPAGTILAFAVQAWNSSGGSPLSNCAFAQTLPVVSTTVNVPVVNVDYIETLLLVLILSVFILAVVVLWRHRRKEE